MNKIYTGIGSRRTPTYILEEMKAFAAEAAKQQWTLRSGGANGADTAFEQGCDIGNGIKEIYLPWANFNGHSSNLHHLTETSLILGASIHPNWKRLRAPSKLLIARNMQQIFGEFLIEPTTFVLCWTPDGCESHVTYSQSTGGTGSAIAAASRRQIPVYNLAQGMDRLERAYQHIRGEPS